jgi:hypothetical protein
MGVRNLPPGFATIKERIQLPNDNKQLVAFKKIYDKLFREFKEKLVNEYAQMKQSYTLEFEANYEANQQEKSNHIQEVQNMLLKKE